MNKLAWLVVIGGALLTVPLLILSFITPVVWSRSTGGYPSGWGMMGGFGFPMMGMMGLGWLVFLALIIGSVVLIARPLTRGSDTRSIPPRGESAFDILQRRYARGEITKDQFEVMKLDLGL